METTELAIQDTVISPQSGGQTEFLSRMEFEVLFGGAAGPGKSWALVIDALGLQFQDTPLNMAAIDVPTYRAVLFRRKTTQLVQLIDEAKRYYTAAPFFASYVSQRRGEPGPSFTFPSGAKIFMCHMEDESDKENHQGIEYQYVGFDELTQFSFTQYTYLFSRCRSTIPFLFPRVRSTTNPIGPGLMWVRKRFYEKLTPRSTYWFLPIGVSAETPKGLQTHEGVEDALSRCYIPGRLEENKILMDSDPTYRSRIKALGTSYEKALLNSDWYAFSGDFFKDFDVSMIISPFNIPEHWPLEGSLDPGWAKPCSFSLRTIDPEGNYIRLGTYYQSDMNAYQHAYGIRDFIEQFPYTGGRYPSIIVSGHDAFAKKDTKAILPTDKTLSDVFLEEVALYLIPAKTDRKIGWWAMKNLQREHKYFVFKHYNEPFLEELSAVVSDEKDPEDIQGRGNDRNVSDHSLDEERYGIMSLSPPPDEVVTFIKGDRMTGRQYASQHRSTNIYTTF